MCCEIINSYITLRRTVYELWQLIHHCKPERAVYDLYKSYITAQACSVMYELSQLIHHCTLRAWSLWVVTTHILYALSLQCHELSQLIHCTLRAWCMSCDISQLHSMNAQAMQFVFHNSLHHCSGLARFMSCHNSYITLRLSSDVWVVTTHKLQASGVHVMSCDNS